MLPALVFHGQARVEWLSATHDFGAFSEDAGPATAVFRGVNTGNEPLVIVGARANCGCTTPRYDLTAVAPGDTVSLQVAYDPAGRPGRFSKKIYVDTNTDPARSTLTIKGVVIGAAATVGQRFPVDMGPLKLSKPTALLGMAKKGHVKSVFLTGYNQSADTIAPQVTDAPRWLSVKAAPQAVGPGEQVSLSFFVSPDRTPLYGLVTDTVTVTPVPGGQSYRLPVAVTINEDFDALTDAQLAKSPAATLSATLLNLDQAATLTLRNDGKTPLTVRRLYTTDPGLTVTAKDTKIKPGKHTVITVTANADGPVNAKVILITNDPLNPTQTIRVVKS